MISKLQYISQGKTPDKHLENIHSACTYGSTWVQLRVKDLADNEVLNIAKEARKITTHFQTRLIINDHYQIAKEIKADGVHLGKTDGCHEMVRKYLGDHYIIGGTANTMEDCILLQKKEVAYIGFGPFKFTETKKNLSPVLGFVGYAAILDKLPTTVPIIAIGGITFPDVPNILATGIYGITISGEITRDFGWISKYQKLLNNGNNREQLFEF